MFICKDQVHTPGPAIALKRFASEWQLEFAEIALAIKFSTNGKMSTKTISSEEARGHDPRHVKQQFDKAKSLPRESRLKSNLISRY